MQARASTIVACAAGKVFDFVTDPANDTKWRSNVVAAAGHVSAVGDTVTQTLSYEGRTRTVAIDVVEYEPPERVAYALHEPVAVRLEFRFRPEGGGTRVSASLSSMLAGPGLLFEGRIQAEADRIIRTDLERLKLACSELIESQ